MIDEDNALDEARALVIEANNSLYGSQGYFHSLKGGQFDKYHLSRGIEELKERIHNLRAENELLKSPWREIGTAPRDGTQILICIAGDEYEPAWAFWSDRFHNWFIPTTNVVYQMEPTHWQPMPEPPIQHS